MGDMHQTAGADAIAVQVNGDNVTVTIGAARLTFARRHLMRAEPRIERDLMLTELRATTLVGRDQDLVDWDAWLASPKPIAMRCLTGRAGAGKTRFAIELCERAEARGWQAGFLPQAELQRFHAAQSLDAWHWGKPTLLIVDYAAAATPILRAWTEALARRRHDPALDGNLRLLLLERHADTNLGWWAALLRPGGLSGRGPEDLADPPTPVALPVLRGLGPRHALLHQVVEAAATLAGTSPPRLPAPGDEPVFDALLSDLRLENEPLFLINAGIVGRTTGVPQALALSDPDLARRVAEKERSRLMRLSETWGIDAAGTRIIPHLAACVTLQGGCDRAAAIATIHDELAAMGWPPPRHDAAAIAGLLHDALPLADGGVDAVRPDPIGAAFVLIQLGDHGRGGTEQADIVERQWRRNAEGTINTVVRTVKEIAFDAPSHPSLMWLNRLIERTGDHLDGSSVLATSLNNLSARPNELDAGKRRRRRR